MNSRLNVDLTKIPKKHLAVALGGAVLGAGLLLYFLFYQPLLSKLRSQASACLTAETLAANAQRQALLFRGVGLEKALIPENEITAALNELTRRGRLLGIQFVSVTPGKIEDEAGKSYRLLPIETEIDSRYEKLAAFLGMLEVLEKGLVTVGSFTVVPDPEDPARVRTRAQLRLHLTK